MQLLSKMTIPTLPVAIIKQITADDGITWSLLAASCQILNWLVIGSWQIS